MQIGGYQPERFLEETKLFKLKQPRNSYFITLDGGVSLNAHMIPGSKVWNEIMVETGTTYAYVPSAMFEAIMVHFDYFCDQTKDIRDDKGRKKYCSGKRFTTKIEGYNHICFDYDPRAYQNREKEYLLGYPIIKFHASDINGKMQQINWYPSEYLFKADSEKYCMMVDVNSKSNQIVFGTSLMRQYDYVFDVGNKQLGIARAECSKHPHMVMSEQEYLDDEFFFGLIDTIGSAGEEQNIEFQT